MLNFFLNNQAILPSSVQEVEKLQYQTKCVYTFDAVLNSENILKITMNDKTDHDLLYIDNNCIDHYSKVREFEIDGIKAEKALHKCSTFTHSMSSEWVEHMKTNGIEILPVYVNATEIRLNGTMELKFFLPFWQWQIENGYE